MRQGNGTQGGASQSGGRAPRGSSSGPGWDRSGGSRSAASAPAGAGSRWDRLRRRGGDSGAVRRGPGSRGSAPQTAQELRERLGLRSGGGWSGADRGNEARYLAASGPRYNGALSDGALSDGARSNGSRSGRAGYGSASSNGVGYNGTDSRGAGYDRSGYDGAGKDRAGYDDSRYTGLATRYGGSRLRDRPESLRDRSRTERQTGPGGCSSRGRDSGGNGGGRGRGPGGGGPDSSGRGFRNWLLDGTWWRRWTWKKAIGVLAGAFVAVLLLIGAAVLYAYGKTSIPTAVSEAALEQSSTVYFSNGKTPVGTFSTGLNRQLLTSAQIPPALKKAVLAAEDRHFYTEGGISITGTGRAAAEDIFGSGGLQGGSTITQQFVRNYYATIGTQQTVSRKIKEIFVAIKLAHEESKDWILTQYLNTVYLGSDAYGVGAAAQTYFSKPALQLDVAQSAMLAAMINQPGYFSPDPQAGQPYAALVARWHYVLTNMVRDGAVTRAQANAQKFPTIVSGPIDNGWTGYRGYIMEAVRNELENTYGRSRQKIYTGGLRIVTTFNASMMNELQRAVNQNLQAMRADGRALPSWANVGAALEQPGTGAILAMYPGKAFSAKHQWNEALQAREQVGSSFKPYVLSTAVQQGMNVQTSQLDGDGPLCVPTDTYPTTPSISPTGGMCPASQYGYYLVHNDYEGSSGPVSVVNASAASINSAYTDLWHRVGGQNVINMAKLFGVNVSQAGLVPGPINKNGMVHEAGMALGQASLSVEEQTTMFATLAANGNYATPHVIAQLSEGSQLIPLKVIHRQVFTNPSSAADVDYALSFDNQPGGTAYPAAAWDRPILAKTGTTNTAQSAFFIGAIPQYSLAVGIFTANQTANTTESLDVLPPLNGQGGGFGGTWPATIWHTFMSAEFANLPVQALPAPGYTGYNPWTQLQPVANSQPKPAPSPAPRPTCGPGTGRSCWSPSPSPSPSPSASCMPAFGYQPCASPTPTGSPQPTPSASKSPGPVQGPRGAASAAPAAEDPAGASAGRRAPG